MRRVLWITLIMLSCGWEVAYSQTDIQGQWWFHTGDNPVWATPAYSIDTTQWMPVQVPSAWEKYPQMEGYDGYGWYRIDFVVPDQILTTPERLFLVTGYIDDVDQVYLNGTLLGQNGKFPPSTESAYYRFRQYPIPEDILKKQNYLAIRVFDNGGTGGIYRGPLGVFTHDQIRKYFEGNSVPHQSVFTMPLSNGFSAAVYNAKVHALTAWYEHIFRQLNARQETGSLFTRAGFTVKKDSVTFTLAHFSPQYTKYEPGTGILSTHYDFTRDLHLNTYMFAPYAFGERVIVCIAELTGKDVSKSRLNFYTEGLNPQVVQVSQTYDYNPDRSVQVNLLGFSPDGKNAILPDIRKLLVNFPGLNALYAERKFWNRWHAGEILPASLSPEEHDLALQSTAFLKMGQVRESGSGEGQIVASLPPGQWNISWVRDMAYAVEALIKTGHLTEAKAALQFQLRAKSGSYVHFMWNGKDYGVQAPYQISVCRYYGDGTEWSDMNDNGPNIELDGFGLFLRTLYQYMQAADDAGFVRDHWSEISGKIADPLVRNIDDYSLIRADSGPWERHLPGNHFTYTSVTAMQGLDAAAKLAMAVNAEEQAQGYLGAVNTLSKGLRTYLVDPRKNIIKGVMEPAVPSGYIDGASVETVNWVLDPDRERTRNTMYAFNTYLKMERTKHGYKRVPTGDWYDHQEWIFVDLRIASGWYHLGEQFRGDQILDWVTNQSAKNYNMISELYDEYTTDYRGAYPMIGFGAGAYVLAVMDQNNTNMKNGNTQ